MLNLHTKSLVLCIVSSHGLIFFTKQVRMKHMGRSELVIYAPHPLKSQVSVLRKGLRVYGGITQKNLCLNCIGRVTIVTVHSTGLLPNFVKTLEGWKPERKGSPFKRKVLTYSFIGQLMQILQTVFLICLFVGLVNQLSVMCMLSFLLLSK